MRSRKIWVMRAGKNSEAQSLFLKSGVIALIDSGLGDLGELHKSREAFYEAYGLCDPDNTITGIRGIGGKYFRFVHEVRIDDIVLFPSRFNRRVYIGNLKSEYYYSPKVDKKFPHQRDVEWQLSFDKFVLSEMAKRELGAARTFFRFKTNVEEIFSIINNEGNNIETKNHHLYEFTCSIHVSLHF